MSFLNRLFGGPKVDLSELVNQGAVMIDVRSKAEFADGHAKGTVNIPLDQIAHKMGPYKKDRAIIVCCKSGMRSASAASQLKSLGYTNVHNAGAWTALRGLK